MVGYTKNKSDQLKNVKKIFHGSVAATFLHLEGRLLRNKRAFVTLSVTLPLN